MFDYSFKLIENANNLDKLKIYNLISQTGGGFFSMFSLKLLIVLLLLVVGIIFIIMQHNYNKTTATVTNIDCKNNKCTLDITYIANNQDYKKELILSKNNDIKVGSTIDIYYNKSNGNDITTSSINNYIIGGIFITFAIYIYFTEFDLRIFKSVLNMSDSDIYTPENGLDNIKILTKNNT